eukprot:Gregarina_sp_Poly_1__10893@NODE_84_length_15393_cov_100_561529_g72_i0_p5_GENE_NODE_84_length_15393_cov_100_561529_g72_i0NODE_84_length_15393_cov_100_561529_g72_i0_p5_ORF_typecomplete_len268_score31_89RVP/PF00077_20/9_9e05Asp_protease/PF09668_10/0_015gagasp_proteas/PF13975_6/0_36_NODE_84_length_15393_cov_100_561529_g72_i056206423
MLLPQFVQSTNSLPSNAVACLAEVQSEFLAPIEQKGALESSTLSMIDTSEFLELLFALAAICCVFFFDSMVHSVPFCHYLNQMHDYYQMDRRNRLLQSLRFKLPDFSRQPTRSHLITDSNNLQPHALILLVQCSGTITALPAIVDTGCSNSCIPSCCFDNPRKIYSHELFESFDGRTQQLQIAHAFTTYLQLHPMEGAPPVVLNAFAISNRDAIIGRDLVRRFNLVIEDHGVKRNDTKELISVPWDEAKLFVRSINNDCDFLKCLVN